jgi:hypothetical protein
MALNPHDVVGEHIKLQLYLEEVGRLERFIDGELKLAGIKASQKDERTIRVRMPGGLDVKVLPEIIARYEAVGWSVGHEAVERKAGQNRYTAHFLRFTTPIAKKLAGVRPSPPKPRVSHAPVNPRSGYVYLLEAENGLYKIGRSKHPRFRIAELTKAIAPFEIKAIHTAWYPDCHQAERELHVAFSEQRRRGEWFALTPADVKAVIEHSYTPA